MARRKGGGGRIESPTSPRKLALRERAKRAMTYRLSGMTYAQIGEQLGVDGTTVENDLKGMLRRIEEPMVEEYRSTNVARIERLLAAVWANAMAGDDKAQQQALRLIHELNMLVGAFAPLKQEVTVDAPDGTLVGVVTQWVPDEQWFAGFAKAWAEVHEKEPKNVTPPAAPRLETSDGASAGVP